MRSGWRRGAAAILAALALPAAAGAPPPRPYVSLTRAFADFAGRTATLPAPERAMRFRREVAPLFPAFYGARAATPAAFDARIVANLSAFPGIEARYARVERAFPAAYAAGIAHFRARFPDFRVDQPVYLLHSLGEMDGGTRTFAGRPYLIFGADVIARVHDVNALGPFLDHELFHLENARAFPTCAAMWCALWQEGLATYAAATMNPRASDAALLLDVPVPLRPAVDARWAEALCAVRARFDATGRGDYAALFMASDRAGGRLPPRFGYYVGYRLLRRIGAVRSLTALTKLPHAPARRLLATALATEIGEAGGCGSAVAAAQSAGQQHARRQL